MEGQLGAALLQFGASGILATALVSLFNRLIAAYERHITYIVNQNAILREENKALMKTIMTFVPGMANEYAKNITQVMTNLDEPELTKK